MSLTAAPKAGVTRMCTHAYAQRNVAGAPPPAAAPGVVGVVGKAGERSNAADWASWDVSASLRRSGAWTVAFVYDWKAGSGCSHRSAVRLEVAGGRLAGGHSWEIGLPSCSAALHVRGPPPMLVADDAEQTAAATTAGGEASQEFNASIADPTVSEDTIKPGVGILGAITVVAHSDLADVDGLDEADGAADDDAARRRRPEAFNVTLYVGGRSRSWSTAAQRGARRASSADSDRWDWQRPSQLCVDQGPWMQVGVCASHRGTRQPSGRLESTCRRAIRSHPFVPIAAAVATVWGGFLCRSALVRCGWCTCLAAPWSITSCCSWAISSPRTPRFHISYRN